MLKPNQRLLHLCLMMGVLLAACGTPTTATPQPTEVVATDVTEVPTDTPLPDKLPQSVAILVIDNFSGRQKTDNILPTPASDGTGSGNCVIDIDGLGEYDVRGTAKWMSDDRPHGEWVRDALFAEANNDNMNFFPTVMPREVYHTYGITQTWESTDQEINFKVLEVDTERFRTNLLAQRVISAVNYVTSTWGITNIVINMSFGVVPCTPLPRASVTETLQAYENLVGQSLNLTELKRVLDTLSSDPEKLRYMYYFAQTVDPSLSRAFFLVTYPCFEPTNGGEPLFSPATRDDQDFILFESSQKDGYLKVLEEHWGRIAAFCGGTSDQLYLALTTLSQRTDLRVASIAAAGNSGEPFPFAPALWNSVLSVSAPTQTVTFETEKGEVVDTTFTANAGELQLDEPAPHDQFIGTSFAAPRVSYWMARYIANSQPLACIGNWHAQKNYRWPIQPPMAYKQFRFQWDNLPVNGALGSANERYCEKFDKIP